MDDGITKYTSFEVLRAMIGAKFQLQPYGEFDMTYNSVKMFTKYPTLMPLPSEFLQ